MCLNLNHFCYCPYQMAPPAKYYKDCVEACSVTGVAVVGLFLFGPVGHILSILATVAFINILDHLKQFVN